MHTLAIGIFGYSDAAYSVSPIAGGFAKGLDTGSQVMSVKIGTIVAVAVSDGALVNAGVTVEVRSTWAGVGETTERQPVRNKVIINNKTWLYLT